MLVDAQTRQKLMLVGVAVLALGAGSYWYLGRDTGESNVAVVNEGPVTRREKKAPTETATKRKKDTRTVTREEPVTVERKERAAPEETTVERKKKRQDRTKEKKKTLAPAA